MPRVPPAAGGLPAAARPAGTGPAGTVPAGTGPGGGAPARAGGRRLGRVALACIGSSLLIMIVVSAAGPSKAVVSVPRAGLGPPWWIALHPAAWLVAVALWVAALAGAGGVAAGLVAARRGWRPPVKMLVVAALAAASGAGGAPARRVHRHPRLRRLRADGGDRP